MARDTASSPCRRAGLPAEHCILQMQLVIERILSMIDSQHTFVEHNAMALVLHMTACTFDFMYTYRYLKAMLTTYVAPQCMNHSYLVNNVVPTLQHPTDKMREDSGETCMMSERMHK